MLPDITTHVVIPGASLIGILFAVIMWRKVAQIQVAGGQAVRGGGREYLLEEQRGDEEVRPGQHAHPYCPPPLPCE